MKQHKNHSIEQYSDYRWFDISIQSAIVDDFVHNPKCSFTLNQLRKPIYQSEVGCDIYL